jgi:hypothetical protein
MSDKKKLEKSARSFKILRDRVGRLFSATKLARDPKQQVLSLSFEERVDLLAPTNTLSGFIDFLSSAVPYGEVYLFGGVLRDLALLGRRGFNSDIDIVVEGGWNDFVTYLEVIGARRNKFGGYRIFAGDWPIDLWNAEETWAIKKGLVEYTGISSLTKTTVLNWDAILMNWRTRNFVCEPWYLDSLRERSLDIVLEENPNPLGMAVRVFRHLSAKDARRISSHAAYYLERCTKLYSFSDLISAELGSYGNSMIEPVLYRLFSLAGASERQDIGERFEVATTELVQRGDGRAWKQLDLQLQE